MSEKKTGGPAFPFSALTPEGQAMYADNEGMTLRDYFAAKAMPQLLEDYFESARKVGFDEDWQIGVALDAYSMADAMLEAREK